MRMPFQTNPETFPHDEPFCASCDDNPTNRLRSRLKVALTGLSLFLILIASSLPASGQLNGRLADRPVGVGYLRDIDEMRMIDYVRRLAQRLSVGELMLKQVDANMLKQLQEASSVQEIPIRGAAWYLVQGLIPSFETITFQQATDDADARRMLKARSAINGDRISLTEVQPNCFQWKLTNRFQVSVPKGTSPEEYVQQQEANRSNSSYWKYSFDIEEQNGKPVVMRTMTHSTWYRIHDSMLFSADFEELLDMSLPTADSLTAQIRSDYDMGTEWHFDRVPTGIRQLAWGMLNGGAGVQMQQRDEEDIEVADLRKSAIEFGLAVAKAAMFDVSEANGWLNFATENEPNVRGELTFATRRNSALTQQLATLSAGRSRFAPILADDAPLTLHLCVAAFADNASLPQAAAGWLLYQAGQLPNADPEVMLALADLATTLRGIGDHGTLEGFLKAGWHQESQGVIYGGLQIDDNPALLNSLLTLAKFSDQRAAVEFSLVENDGLQLLQLMLPAEFTSRIAQHTGLQLTHVYLAHQNSCLWLAVGQEDAWRMLQLSISRCREAGPATGMALLTAAVDFQTWQQLPADDPVGVGGLLTWLDANQPAFPPGPMTMAFAFQSRGDQKPTPLLTPVLEMGGGQQAEFRIVSDTSGLQVQLKLGEALAHYSVARMIDLQEQVQKRSRQAAEKAREAQEKSKLQQQKNDDKN